MIIDTDFFSSFLKINKLKLILKSLNTTHLIIPSTVYEELKESPFFNENNHLFTYDKNNLTGETYVLIKKVNLDNLSKYFNLEKIKKLGDGEKGCFLLTKETKGDILSTLKYGASYIIGS